MCLFNTQIASLRSILHSHNDTCMLDQYQMHAQSNCKAARTPFSENENVRSPTRSPSVELPAPIASCASKAKSRLLAQASRQTSSPHRVTASMQTFLQQRGPATAACTDLAPSLGLQCVRFSRAERRVQKAVRSRRDNVQAVLASAIDRGELALAGGQIGQPAILLHSSWTVLHVLAGGSAPLG